jgi:molybdate transport system ATP-binding protein
VLEVQFEAQLGSFHIDMGFEAGPGRTTVLLGESGSGKSTVLKFISGLLEAKHGSLIIDDELYVDTAAKFAIPAQERPIGYVFQDYVLFPHLSVFDNVAFGLKMQKVKDEVIKQRVGEALEQVHLVGYDDRHPKELSGGQQQRVAIARALALSPQLLLLDESLSALDIQTRHEVARELREILLRLKLTTVMVSHQYSDALNFADHIIVLEQGRVIQAGVHLDLLRHPHSAYIAEMVGVNRFTGTLSSIDDRGACTVALAGPDTAEPLEVKAVAGEGKAGAVALRPGDEVTVIVHPRSVTLHTTDPGDSEANVHRCEILQSIPVSADFSTDDGAMRGLMRIVMDLTPNLPPLRAEIGVSGPSDLDLSVGKSVYAAFGPDDAKTYSRSEEGHAGQTAEAA